MKRFLIALLSLACLIFMPSLTACGDQATLSLDNCEVGYEFVNDLDGEKEISFTYKERNYTFYVTSFSASLNAIYRVDELPENIAHPYEVLIKATGYTSSENAGMEVCLTYLLSDLNSDSFFPTAIVQADGSIVWNGYFYCETNVTVFIDAIEIVEV